MRDILSKEEFNIEIQPKAVLQLIQCYENSPIYDEVLKEYEELKPKVLNRIQSRAVLCFTTIEEEYASILPLESPVLYAITTIGQEIVELSRRYYAEDEYLKSMLVDTMADAYLFEMEEEMKIWIKEECVKRRFGVSNRYEAPANIPMEVHKVAYDLSNARENMGISITNGYMFDPVKTNCQVFSLTGDTQVFHIDHDCSQCNNVACTVRSVPKVIITVVSGKGEKKLLLKEKDNLLSLLIRESIITSSFCQGNGTCGKCKIQVLDGEIDITSFDKKHFSDNELAIGFRLACQAYPKNDCKIQIIKRDEDDFYILSDYKKESQKIAASREVDYSIAIDIGTTTLVIDLVGNTSKISVDTFVAVNGQRKFGADVISRIQASINGLGEELCISIRKDILNGIKQLLRRNDLNNQMVKEVVIAGNTTMGHLLMGFDCSKLGVFPFIPVNIELMKHSFREVFKSSHEKDCIVTILPGISAFVGGDIVSGLYFCGFHKTDKINLLIDLGTNGEMGIGNRNKIITTSTAAGPAFEGGNITWGTGSIMGAICNVNITDNQVEIITIGNKEPVGICGTGVVEAVAELVKNKIVDETGLMMDDYFDEGYPLGYTPDGERIVITQKDIRELQLAKAAIRAGIETLLLRYSVSYEQIDKVFIAGGLGVKLDQDKAIAIGMLPEEFTGRIEAVGNSSLGGAVKYLKEDNSLLALEQIVRVSSEINLSNDLAFNDFYMEHMFFGESE